jgi:F0F1-type ATP synthase assembly protein I
MTQETDRRPWLQYSVAGKAFILPLLVLMGVGWLLDRWTGLFPGFSVLGAIVGFFLGLWILVRIERRLVEQEQHRRAGRSGQEDEDSSGPEGPGRNPES